MRSRKRKNDTLYHILFWVIVVILFPISLSVWFFRRNPLNIAERTRHLIIALFWAVLSISVFLIIMVPITKNRRELRKESESASAEASRQESIAESEAEAKRLADEEAANSKLEITFYDMGQADAILISCEDHFMLIDSGDLSVSLSAKILEKDISYVDYIVASTPQNESVGGIARALNHISVGQVFCTVTDYDSDKFTEFLAALEAQGKNITVPDAGDTYSLGSAQITFIGPVSAPESEETSLILKITHQGNTFLFAGFADSEQLSQSANAGYDLSADLIKVGRHGRENALNQTLASMISPSFAVISDGEGYGCPSESVLQLLCNNDVKLFRTDLQGNISVVSSLGGISVSAEENADTDTYQGITKQQSEADSAEAESTEAPTQSDSSLVFETGEATPNASGWRYGRLLSDMVFHRVNCPCLTNAADDEKEYYEEGRDELAGWGFTPCDICHPMD